MTLVSEGSDMKNTFLKDVLGAEESVQKKSTKSQS